MSSILKARLLFLCSVIVALMACPLPASSVLECRAAEVGNSTSSVEPPPYVVLTNLDKKDPYFEAAQTLADAHQGTIIRFRPDKVEIIRAKVAKADPRYVAVVLRPEDIDINLQRYMLKLSTSMDDDPFCDFAFGFITGATAEDALTMVKRSMKAQKNGLPKTMVSASVISGSKSYCYEGGGTPLEKELGYKSRSIYWACVENDPDVLDFVDEHIKEIQGKGVVELYGCGDPEGIWLFGDQRNMDRSKHWRFDPEKVGSDPDGEMPRITAEYFTGLDLGGAVVWSGTCHSGVLCRAYVEGAIVSTFGTVDRVTEYMIPKGKSLALATLAAGPSAYIAPIGPNHGYAGFPEVYRVLSTGMPLGDLMRTRYNEIIFADNGELDIARYEAGAAFPAEDPMRGGGVNRTLYGDPLFAPFPDPEKDYLQKKVRPLTKGKGIVAECTVIDTVCGMFWDMFGDDRENAERIYTFIELPNNMEKVSKVLATAESSEGKEIAITAPAFAIERIDGKTLIHLQVNAPRKALEKKGTKVVFTIR